MRVLVVATSGDPSLANSYWIAEQNALRLKQDETTVVHRVVDADVTRASFEGALGHDIQGIAAFTHGQAHDTRHGLHDALLGVEGESILDGDNVALLAGRWVHAFACRSGVELPGLAVAAGSTCFVGYEIALLVEWSPEEIPAPIRTAFIALVTEVTWQLANGARDQKSILQALAPHQEVILGWCDAHPGEAGGVAITAQQLMSGLVCRSSSPNHC